MKNVKLSPFSPHLIQMKRKIDLLLTNLDNMGESVEVRRLNCLGGKLVHTHTIYIKS